MTRLATGICGLVNYTHQFPTILAKNLAHFLHLIFRHFQLPMLSCLHAKSVAYYIT